MTPQKSRLIKTSFFKFVLFTCQIFPLSLSLKMRLKYISPTAGNIEIARDCNVINLNCQKGRKMPLIGDPLFSAYCLSGPTHFTAGPIIRKGAGLIDPPPSPI